MHVAKDDADVKELPNDDLTSEEAGGRDNSDHRPETAETRWHLVTGTLIYFGVQCDIQTRKRI